MAGVVLALPCVERQSGLPGGGRVYFHGAPEGLLRGGRHGVGFVQNDKLVAARGQRDFLLGEHFDFGADHVDASRVRRVELEDGVARGRAQHLE